jgi:D-amino-acid dehydrogenase
MRAGPPGILPGPAIEPLSREAPGVYSARAMKVLVLGGGVVGVTTAYFLARVGHEVTLLEEKDGLGLEATGGNAGIIAPGHSFAWASPRAPHMLWQSLRGAETAIRLRPGRDPGLYAWGLRFLRECTAARARRNTLVKLRLCQYSQAVMNELVQAEGLEYHAVSRGALYLYRDAGELEAGARKMALLAEHGQRQEILDPAAVARLDPVFGPVRARIAGAIRDLGDSSGDSRVFSEGLARVAADKHGLTVKLGTRVLALTADRERIDGVVTSGGLLTADAYVLALGVGAPGVARTVGLRLPIYPAKGYSSTFPLKPGGLAPTVPGVDERWLVGWSRLGDRLRLTSTAEFTGYDWGWTPGDFNNIRRLAAELFPDAADYERGEYRACLRPMTPDGPPILGLGRHRNLFLNCGHGHMGWTMACGTARIVADLMTGRMPDIDLQGLTFGR